MGHAYLVFDVVCEMPDYEGGLAEPRLFEMLPLLALVVQLLHPRLVRPLRHAALLVKQVL